MKIMKSILNYEERRKKQMAFFQSAVTTLQTLVVALGAGLGIWGAINLMHLITLVDIQKKFYTTT